MRNDETGMYVAGNSQKKLVNWKTTLFSDFGEIRPYWQIMSLEITKDDKRLWVGYEDGYLLEWCTVTNKIIKNHSFLYYWIGSMCI